ncbi:DNA-binding MarR family transcriptional regulator [Paenibacillus shirakamiensis]|uniref:DNA-binding MarR family transcriptional regulator n=1 Tax=Paenibacillus shirakamiensis TaxID=1265935 RepID=A0ABS4JLN7_9BACL|nr:MarR family transcriptional regulator [Paenibacillus shirakamiensis]MBP2002006.1 DNA-binding MarR family transcriptional regulator [Paenibacillus shirakamiensis]
MDTHALFQQFVTFTDAVHQATHDFTRDVRDASITPVQYHILEYIALHQPVTLSQISECQQMSMPNTSREIRKLSEKYLCEKVIADEDRRKQYIRLSPQGENMMHEAFARIEERFLARLGRISASEKEEMEQAMDLLAKKIFKHK